MKKFTKLAAVFAALVLAWACFVACSNSSSDSGSNGADDSSSNSGSDSGSNSGSTTISVQALQGLWLDKNENGGEGWWIKDNILYPAIMRNGKYIYEEDEPSEFSISGNTINCSINGFSVKIEPKINGDTLTLKYTYNGEEDEEVLKKINAIPNKNISTPGGE